MGRRQTRELVRAIISSLAAGPKSINELARDCSSNWESVRNYLESLDAAGIVKEVQDGNRRVFSLAREPTSEADGTYFGLPLDQRKKELIDAFYSKIREEWKKRADVFPGKVQVYKTLFKVDKILNLDLPIGWYQYGALCVRMYEPANLTTQTGLLSEKQIVTVSSVVSEYSDEPTTMKLKLRQYAEEGKVLYLAKELLWRTIVSETPKKQIDLLEKELTNFLKFSPFNMDRESKTLLSSFYDLLMKIFSEKNSNEILELRGILMSCFEKVWKLVALYQYKNDLTRHYSKEVLDAHFNYYIDIQKVEAAEAVSYLDELFPEVSEDSETEKLRALIDSIDSEMASTNEKIDSIRKNKGDKGVQDFLETEFGISK